MRRVTTDHHARGEAGMAETFDQASLRLLHDAVEVAIRTSARPDRAIVIWVVVIGDAVFARSFRGPGAKWYVAAIADRRAALALDDRQWPVGVTPVADPTAIAEVSRAYLEKYATSPYAKEMVRSEILPTTVRLDPL
jgi:hypothetical protein